MKMEKARIVSTSSHPSVEKNGLAIFFTSRNERTSLRLFLSGDFGATEDLARFRRGCWHDPKSEEHRAVQSILQEQPDPPLLGIRYITLCSRMGFKNMCLQRKNVRKGKRCVWGYCFSGTTQQSPVLVAKLALTLAAPCQWEVLGRHTPDSGGSHQSSGNKPWGESARASCYWHPPLPVQKLPPAPEQSQLLEDWGFPHAALQHHAGKRGERQRIEFPQGASGEDLL